MEAKRSLAVLWNHCLAILENAQSVASLFQFRVLAMTLCTHTAPRCDERNNTRALLGIRIDYGWNRLCHVHFLSRHCEILLYQPS
jgi:hypothetical protein